MRRGQHSVQNNSNAWMPLFDYDLISEISEHYLNDPKDHCGAA